MEASVVNTIVPGDRVLAADNGLWGRRFAAIARAFAATVDMVEFPPGEAVDPDVIASKLRGAACTYKAVFVTHNESSTGR